MTGLGLGRDHHPLTKASLQRDAFIGWYTMAAGFDGFLLWAYFNWVKEPQLDSRFRTWPAVDTCIVYPGGRGYIRFERLVEGRQDAEKIRLLRENCSLVLIRQQRRSGSSLTN